ncbi:MAG: transcription antitermination factor NusB, partial [Clostridia bacterium]|nr:transcription antitermination factor NusB [Clostridia bacterium]
DIDAQIAQNARKWKLSRMAAVTRSILRLAVYEILWGEVPPRAAINEAVELAKLYDEEAAPAFINGILNQIAKESGKLGETESEKTDDAE